MTITTRKARSSKRAAVAKRARNTLKVGLPVEQSRGNVFADLGLPDSDLRLAKAEFARAIKRVIVSHDWTQSMAAATADLTSSDMSDICRGKLAKFSLERLEKALLSLGIDIEVRLTPTRAGAARGVMRVVGWRPE